VAAARLEGDAPVLGQALLADVELGEDLDARDDRALERPRDAARPLLERAGHTIAHADAAALGLDVDIRGLALDPLGDDLIDEPLDLLASGRVRGLLHVVG